jgi:hypothetical protein
MRNAAIATGTTLFNGPLSHYHICTLSHFREDNENYFIFASSLNQAYAIGLPIELWC